jgi:hypothetical protein
VRGVFFLVLIKLVPLSLIGQTYKDTLFYKSGLERVCKVNYYDLKNINYTYTSAKGDTLTHDIKQNQLNYFVVYDSSGVLQFSSKEGLDLSIEEDTSTTYKAPDSIFVRQHILSVNPFSIPVLGLNVSYTWRFGSNLQYGLHVPLRVTSPYLFGAGNMAFYTGLGFTAFVVDNKKFSMTLDVTPSVYIISGEVDPIFALPFTIGFVRYLRPYLAIDGRIGAGPGFSSSGVTSYPLPAAHIGIAFLIGKEIKIKAD